MKANISELPVTCGACAYSAFSRTAKGKIKQGLTGSCTKEKDLLAMYQAPKNLPCIVFSRATMTRIWPEDDANECPMFNPAVAGKRLIGEAT